MSHMQDAGLRWNCLLGGLPLPPRRGFLFSSASFGRSRRNAEGNESDRIHNHSQRQQDSTTCIACEILAASNRLNETHNDGRSQRRA